MRYLLLFLTTSSLVVGCKCESSPAESGNGKLAPAEKKVEDLGPIKAPEIEPPNISESKGGEMLPGLSFPKGFFGKVDAGSEPPGKDGLIKMAQKAVKKGNTMEALAVLDVLVLMHPTDPLVFEMRGDVLLSQGNREDGMADLDRCCILGRDSCCR